MEHTIRQVLSGPFTNVFTVIGFAAERVKQSIIIDDARFRWLVNTDYATGQSSSFQLGIKHATEQGHAVMVFLGDLPFISSEVIQSIYRLGDEIGQQVDEPFVIQPSYQGQPGHPTFFGNVQIEMFQHVHGDQGARSIMKQMRKIPFPCDDPGIVFDIDTPEVYEQAKQLLSAGQIKVSRLARAANNGGEEN